MKVSYYTRTIKTYFGVHHCSCILIIKSRQHFTLEGPRSFEVPISVGEGYLPTYDSIRNFYRDHYFNPNTLFSNDYMYQRLNKHLLKKSWSF